MTIPDSCWVLERLVSTGKVGVVTEVCVLFWSVWWKPVPDPAKCYRTFGISPGMDVWTFAAEMDGLTFRWRGYPHGVVAIDMIGAAAYAAKVRHCRPGGASNCSFVEAKRL